MKRKVGLFLLAIMIAVGLGATVVVSLAMDRPVTHLQAQAPRAVGEVLAVRSAPMN